MTPSNSMGKIQKIPFDSESIRTRGGFYSPGLNTWVADGFNEYLQNASESHTQLLDAYAEMALLAGKIHKAQLADNGRGRIWPAGWIENRSGQELVEFCRKHPHAATPYSCVTDRGEIIPFSKAYAEFLHPFCAGIERALASGDPSAGKQADYLRALQAAFTFQNDRQSDLEAMGVADTAWVRTPAEIPVLLLAEFAESYSDPLKSLAQLPEVNAWAKEVSLRNGMGPWKFYFEFRVLANEDRVLSHADVESIRATNRRLYGGIEEILPSENAVTEFRKVLIVAGHGSNPPKNAKNYPNQTWIRQKYGYRNIIYANQVEASLSAEILPALRAAFNTGWSNTGELENDALRLRALFLVAHEETHPWLCFSELPWMEEFKSDILGRWTILNTPSLKDSFIRGLMIDLGVMLLQHRHHEYLLRRGDHQFADYHIGRTIFLNHLFNSGFFVVDSAGMIIDINHEQAMTALETMAGRILAIKQRKDSAQTLYNDLHSETIYDRFGGWRKNQAYFEKQWS